MRTWFGRGRSLQLAVTSCCLMAFVLFGYDQGVFGGILLNEDWLELFDHPNDTLTGIIVSSYNLGCLTGCFTNFAIGERLGRRRAIWTAMGFVLIGATLQTSAFSLPHLIVGRIVTGIGTGIKTSTVPMYQSELCEPRKRGRLVSAEVLFVGVGIVTAYWFDFGLSYVGGPLAWRLPLAFQMVFAFWVIFIVFGIPESPRWLSNHGHKDEAREALCAIYDKEPDHPDIVAEMEAIEKAIMIETKAQRQQSFLTIFKKDRINTRYRVFLAWFQQLMNQLSGINLVVYYITTVLTDSVGLAPRLSQILGGCINLMFVIGSLLPTFALDRMGRRVTMILGNLGLGICMLLISALLSQSETANGKAYSSAAVAFFFLYMLVFGASMNCVPWCYVPEILPLEARTRGTAIGISANWLWNFFVVMITPVILNRLSWKAYLIFMATSLAFVPICYFIYPETANLALEEVDLIFEDGGDPVKVARMLQKEIRRSGSLAVRREEGANTVSEKDGVGVENIEHV